MRKHIVLNTFRDREDNLSTYKKGEEYPREGAPSFHNKRAEELVSKGFIKEYEKNNLEKERKENVKKI